MFKRGVITDEISQDFEIAADLAVEYGLDGVEIRSVWEKGAHELDGDDTAKIRSILKDTGLKACCIGSSFNKCDFNKPEDLKENTEVLKKSVKLAQSLDTNLIRGFTFWNTGGFEDNFEKIISNFEEPLKLIEKEGMILALEFDPSVFASNARKLVKVIEALDSPYIKALWDPGNDIYDPDGEIPFPNGYDLIKKHMMHMHLKDAKRLDDGRVTGVPLGKGDVDLAGQFRELKASGYDGFVVLETHYRPKHDIGEALLALPKGSAFSYMGYEATIECLANWEKLMEVCNERI